MFGIFKRRNKTEGNAESPTDEFRRRAAALYYKHSIEDTPYDELLDAMAAVENEMMRNGGINWVDGDYSEYLDTIRHHLRSDSQFGSEELSKIDWAINELAEFGQELEQKGKSGRAVKAPIECLVASVVAWCRKNEASES